MAVIEEIVVAKAHPCGEGVVHLRLAAEEMPLTVEQSRQLRKELKAAERAAASIGDTDISLNPLFEEILGRFTKVASANNPES